MLENLSCARTWQHWLFSLTPTPPPDKDCGCNNQTEFKVIRLIDNPSIFEQLFDYWDALYQQVNDGSPEEVNSTVDMEKSVLKKRPLKKCMVATLRNLTFTPPELDTFTVDVRLRAKVLKKGGLQQVW